MKKVVALIALTIASSSFTALADDFVYPDTVLDKVAELKALVDQKKDMPTEIDGIKSISTNDAYSAWKSKKAIFLDTRPKAQFDTEKIPDAISLDADKMLEDPTMAKDLDKSKEYITYCSGVLCRRAPGGALQLKAMGFTNVRFYRAGLPDWKAKGYPVK